MMKRSLLSFALLALVSVSGHAQERNGPGPRHDPVARMTEELQLSKTQATQLADIMNDARAQHETLQTTGRAEHCAIRAKTQSQIADILTDEQYTRFEELRTERQARHGEGRGRGKGKGKGRHHPPLDCSGQLSNSDPAD